MCEKLRQWRAPFPFSFKSIPTVGAWENLHHLLRTHGFLKLCSASKSVSRLPSRLLADARIRDSGIFLGQSVVGNVVARLPCYWRSRVRERHPLLCTDRLVYHRRFRLIVCLLRILHTSNPANTVIIAAMPQWFTVGTPGGGRGAPPH